MITSAFLIAAMTTGSTLLSAFHDFYAEYNVEDAEFTVYNTPTDEELQAMETTYDTLVEKNRYKNVDGFEDSTVRVFAATKKVNRYSVTEGNDISSDDDILITKKYADYYGINIGDEITLGGQEFNVCGFAVKSDYAYMLEELSDAYRNIENFGLAIVTDTAFDQFSEMETSYYGIIYQKDNASEVRSYINENFMTINYLNNDSNKRISMPLSQGRDVNSMAEMIAPIFFGIVIIIVSLVISRIIKKESSIIGTLLALGYDKNKIVKFYGAYGLIPGVIGSLLGLLIGKLLIAPFCAFYIELDFEPLSYQYDYSLIVFLCAILLPSLLYVFVSILVAKLMLKRNAIDLIHNTSSDQKTIGILKHSNMKIRRKFQIRNILGHKQKSLVLIAGVMVASGLLAIGLNSYYGFSYVADKGVSDNVNYKYMYVLNSMEKQNDTDGEGVLIHNYEVEDSTVQLSTVGLYDDTKFFDYKTIDGEDMDLEKWYISSAAASTYSLSKGDTFTFRDINTLEEETVNIAGIIEDNIHVYLFSGNKNVAALIGIEDDYYNVIVSDKEINIDETKVFSKTSVGMSQSQMKELLSEAMIGVYALLFVGFILSMLVIYMIVNMTINEKKPSISLMKILGFKKREVSAMIINSDMILVLIGYLIGILLGTTYSAFEFRTAVAKYGMSFELVIRPEMILISLAIILLAYLVSTSLLKRKAFRLDMVESLKDFRNE
jgi:putative ABC transport system permease protein